MKKKKIFVLLVLLCVLLSSMNVLANETTEDNEMIFSSMEEFLEYSKSPERIIKEKEIADQALKEVEKLKNSRANVYASVNISLYQQQEYYTCGPASARMLLSAHGYYPSEGTLASAMGTNTSGTIVGNIPSVLNSYVGSGKYSYMHTSNLAFYNGLLASLNRGCPVICNVSTGVLPIYYENNKNIQHYITAHGMYSGTYVGYNDPHYESTYYGTHSTTIDNMKNAINNNFGYYIMGTR